MALEDIRNRVQALATECEAIAAKASMTDADLTRVEAITVERGSLEQQMAAVGKLNEFKAWAGQSAGGVSLVGTQPAGTATLTQREPDKGGRKSVLLSDEGDMLIDANTYKAISSTEYGRAFRSYLRVGQNGLKSEALKVLQEGIDTQGGYLVPEDMLTRIISKEPAPTNLAGRVSTFTTSSDSLVMPQVIWTTDNIYTTGMRVTWTGELPTSATQHRVTEPVWGQVRIPIYTAMMSLPLSVNFVEDQASNVTGWASGKFSETIDLLKDNMIINGTGVAQPTGILANANFVTNDVHTGAAGALTWAGILSLLYALPEQYDRNATAVMNKTNTALALSQLVDGNGRPYWSDGNSGFTAQRINQNLLGYPVLFNAFMPNTSAGLYPIIFGDLGGYYLVNRIGMSIQVLRELYAETNQIVLLGRVRFGGQLVEDWRLRGQVVSA
ncbi:MAG: phage major capsid protein [Candidatus Gracilibacteria bacterium]|jgi:HK97 family phage major capsid protein